jgi:hypothetical protein
MNDHPRLSKTELKYWNLYIDSIEQTPVNLIRLEDLCYWEERKDAAKKEIDKLDSEVIIETDKNGKVIKAQSHPAIGNLKVAQEKIELLRFKLFGGKLRAGKNTPKNEAESEDGKTKLRALR